MADKAPSTNLDDIKRIVSRLLATDQSRAEDVSYDPNNTKSDLASVHVPPSIFDVGSAGFNLSNFMKPQTSDTKKDSMDVLLTTLQKQIENSSVDESSVLKQKIRVALINQLRERRQQSREREVQLSQLKQLITKQLVSPSAAVVSALSSAPLPSSTSDGPLLMSTSNSVMRKVNQEPTSKDLRVTVVGAEKNDDRGFGNSKNNQSVFSRLSLPGKEPQRDQFFSGDRSNWGGHNFSSRNDYPEQFDRRSRQDDFNSGPRGESTERRRSSQQWQNSNPRDNGRSRSPSYNRSGMREEDHSFRRSGSRGVNRESPNRRHDVSFSQWYQDYSDIYDNEPKNDGVSSGTSRKRTSDEYRSEQSTNRNTKVNVSKRTRSSSRSQDRDSKEIIKRPRLEEEPSNIDAKVPVSMPIQLDKIDLAALKATVSSILKPEDAPQPASVSSFKKAETHVLQTVTIRGFPFATAADIDRIFSGYDATVAPMSEVEQVMGPRKNGPERWMGDIRVSMLINKQKLIPGYILADTTNNLGGVEKRKLTIKADIITDIEWCETCLTQGHLSVACPNDDKLFKKGLWCTLCRCSGHLNQDCPADSTQYTDSLPKVTVGQVASDPDARHAVYECFPEAFRMQAREIRQTYQNQVTHFGLAYENPVSILSNRAMVSFEINGTIYKSNEHYYHSRLAMVSGFPEMAKRIVHAPTIDSIKGITREMRIKPQNETLKIMRMFKFLEIANKAKFSQDEQARMVLLGTKGSLLAESLGTNGNLIWTTGVDGNVANLVNNTKNWPGYSVFGDLLTIVRDRYITNLGFPSPVAPSIPQPSSSGAVPIAQGETTIMQTVTLSGYPNAKFHQIQEWFAKCGITLAPKYGAHNVLNKVTNVWDGSLRVAMLVTPSQHVPALLKVNVYDEWSAKLVEKKICLTVDKKATKNKKKDQNIVRGLEVQMERTAAAAVGSLSVSVERDGLRQQIACLPPLFLKSVEDLGLKYTRSTHFAVNLDGPLKVLSNCALASVTVNNVIYRTNEHYCQSELAKETGNVKLVPSILNAPDAKTVMRIARAVRSKSKDQRYLILKKFKLLGTINKAKYEQNAYAREILFATAGSRLAESIGPNGDLVWTTGLRHEEIETEVDDPKLWRGLNVFGDLLTVIRDTMMDAGVSATPVPLSTLTAFAAPVPHQQFQYAGNDSGDNNMSVRGFKSAPTSSWI